VLVESSSYFVIRRRITILPKINKKNIVNLWKSILLYVKKKKRKEINMYFILKTLNVLYKNTGYKITKKFFFSFSFVYYNNGQLNRYGWSMCG